MEKALIINYKDVDIQRDDNVILYNVDFEVHEGEFVYLTGIVGSGKTSLLKTIYGELDIETGTAQVLDRNMRTIKRRHIPALRKQLGIVFQDFRLLPDRNVRKNLDFVLRSTGWKNRRERADRISEVLATVGLADKLEAMPYELSGGEQQRICIARAILNTPRLILADEATGNQDAESGIRTTEILYNLSKQGTAVIMATHNNALLERFPGVVYECRDHRLIRHDGNAPADESVSDDSSSVRSNLFAHSNEVSLEKRPVLEGSSVAERRAGPSVVVEETTDDDDIPVATVATIPESE